MDSFKKNILDFPGQLTSSHLRLVNEERLRRLNPDHIIITGMGGSGLAGMILRAARRELGIRAPILLWKNYGLPLPREILGRHPLFIFVSFSGNTEEVLSGLAELKKRGFLSHAAVVTTGGKLGTVARHKKLPAAFFEASDLTPRQAVGTMFYGISELLKRASLLTNAPREYTHLEAREQETSGKRLARKLKDHLPLIYTTPEQEYLGYIWKIKFNETAKQFAFHHVLPEMNHNEIVGFEIPKNVRALRIAALFLYDFTAPLRLQKRFVLTERLLRKAGTLTLSLPQKGKQILEQTWNMIMLADWTTYFLAKYYDRDPKETKVIEALKRAIQ